ncbi:hypothetical protein [Anaerosporobacter sp.]|uniref:hypothetical protein n=1 Tax=Anaerosporobacter sp. TaxID=1872529 RepID=UPI00286ED019|nr:hypothetical protein [Anaerosporobacter sp.]
MKRKVNTIMIGLLIAVLLVGCGKSSGKNKENTNKNGNIAVREDATEKENENIDENENTLEREEKLRTTDTLPAYKTEVTPLLKVKFTAQKKVTVTDLTEYWKGCEETNERKVVEKAKEIPDALITMLTEHVMEKNGVVALDSMLIRTGISEEEYVKHSKVELDETCWTDVIQVDGDNDGIDDLVSLTFYGGTSGFSELELCKGNGDGTYTLTDSYSCLRTSIGAINYEGINYILLRDFDYDTNYYSGYKVYLYDKGVLVDARRLSIKATDYEMDILQEESDFAEIEEIKTTLCKKEYPSILENSDYSIYGTAEEVRKEDTFVYSCDIDNDGTVERYNKEMFWPSTMWNIMHCSYDFEDSTLISDISNDLEEKGEKGKLYTFWLDKVGNQNVLYMYIVEDLDYKLYAFSIQKKEVFGVEKILAQRIEQVKELGLMRSNELQKAKLIEGISEIPEEVINEMGERELCGMILDSIGGGTFDYDSGEWTSTSDSVYSFDVEMFWVDKMYTQFLEGVSAITYYDDIRFTEIEEQTGLKDSETGKEIQRIRFRCNEKQYQYDAVVDNDWFDVGMIAYMNEVLKEHNSEKQLWVTSDGYQNCILFYETAEWAKEFEKSMGYALEQ